MANRNLLGSTSSRRATLAQAGNGLLGLALSHLLNQEAFSQKPAISLPVRARNVIYLYMEGGPSQVDTFDYKPRLARDHGKSLPLSTPNTVFNIGNTVMRSPFRFQQHGNSGAWVSELFPHVAQHVDDITFIHSMHHGVSNHSSACYISHTGYADAGKPSVGAWISYGLGSLNNNLPSFIVLDCGMGPAGGPPSWGSGFLPASYQGTRFRPGDVPIPNITPKEKDPLQQANKLNAILKLNRASGDFQLDDRWSAAVDNYETAWRMQSSVPGLVDLSTETTATQKLYGLDEPQSQLFGSRCLLARKLVEKGVRFVEIFPPKVKADRWDQHGNLEEGHRLNATATDRGIAGLLMDLKQRGLLEETIVMWGGEFGRTPNQQGTNGRDHNPFGFTVWVAGGGFKPGIQHGATDDFGYFAVHDKVHLHDLHATLLYQLGLHHEDLTYRFSGRDFRLTDVHGEVTHAILQA
ncbi:MAG: DUF1501 domain-containing protein [Pirellulaceae bacterium]|nr:DUF1501 domain-containing protein [Pirellulaceae bacterium]